MLGELTEPQRGSVKRIRSGVQSILVLLGDLLDLSRAEGTRRIAIDVADSGPGIPSDKLELVFEEFTRLDHSGKPGAGLGLAIARRIARLLDGDITVTSEVGRGSCFTLWLRTVRA